MTALKEHRQQVPRKELMGRSNERRYYWLYSYGEQRASAHHSRVSSALQQFVAKITNKKNFSLGDKAKEDVLVAMVDARDEMDEYINNYDWR